MVQAETGPTRDGAIQDGAIQDGAIQDGATPAAILLAADRACFVAKRDGRNRVATAADGLALAAEFSLQEPTPVDSTTLPDIE